MVDYEGLHERLIRVKKGLSDKLAQGELEKEQYYKTVYQLLFDENIVTEPYEKDTMKVSVFVGFKLLSKIPTKEYMGLERRYISREDIALSPKAQEDIKKLSDIEGLVRDYLKEQIGNKPIFESEYDGMVRDYLFNKQGLLTLLHEDRMRCWCIIGFIEGRLRSEVNIKSDFEKREEYIGGYNTKKLEEALNKL